MGCVSSKQKQCKHCRGAYSPVPRSYSVHVHHPAQHKGDSYHMVALTSSTLGSMNGTTVDSISQRNIKVMDNEVFVNGFDHNYKANGDLFEDVMGVGEKGKGNGNQNLHERLMEAKVWSSMMQDRIPKMVPRTPIVTPPGEPETINTWELMEGLEDVSPLRSPNHFRSFSFDVLRSPPMVPFELPKSSFQENGLCSPPKPMWLRMQENDQDLDCRIPEFDPEIISSFRKSFQELPPDHPFHIEIANSEQVPILANGALSDGSDTDRASAYDDFSGEEEKVVDFPVTNYERSSFSKNKVILYFTSLRGVRKTYEDCCHVRVILKGLGVRVDERDMSMHSGFKDELKELLGDKFSGNGISLPRVFVGRQYIGGAEEIRKLNEDGKLEKVLEGCEFLEDNGCGGGHNCEACGDIRFVPCDTCSGSCKVYYECSEDEEGDREAEGEFGFQRCPHCNENGLIRCPACCD